MRSECGPPGSRRRDGLGCPGDLEELIPRGPQITLGRTAQPGARTSQTRRHTSRTGVRVFAPVERCTFLAAQVCPKQS